MGQTYQNVLPKKKQNWIFHWSPSFKCPLCRPQVFVPHSSNFSFLFKFVFSSPLFFRFSFYVLSTNRLTISLSLSHLLPCLSQLFRIFHKCPFTCLSLCLSICLSLLSETSDRCVFIVWVLLNVVYLEASRSFFYPWILF